MSASAKQSGLGSCKAYNTSLNLTRHVGASRLVARRLALRWALLRGAQHAMLGA